MKNNPVHRDSPGRHEPVARSLRSVFIIAGAVVTMILLCLISTQAVLHDFSKKHPGQPTEALGILTAPNKQPLTHFPAPTLELDDGHGDFSALKKRQSDDLASYGWIDRTNQIARIPIERAMDLIAGAGMKVTNLTVTASSRLQMEGTQHE